MSLSVEITSADRLNRLVVEAGPLIQRAILRRQLMADDTLSLHLIYEQTDIADVIPGSIVEIEGEAMEYRVWSRRRESNGQIQIGCEAAWQELRRLLSRRRNTDGTIDTTWAVISRTINDTLEAILDEAPDNYHVGDIEAALDTAHPDVTIEFESLTVQGAVELLASSLGAEWRWRAEVSSFRHNNYYLDLATEISVDGTRGITDATSLGLTHEQHAREYVSRLVPVIHTEELNAGIEAVTWAITAIDDVVVQDQNGNDVDLKQLTFDGNMGPYTDAWDGFRFALASDTDIYALATKSDENSVCVLASDIPAEFAVDEEILILTPGGLRIDYLPVKDTHELETGVSEELLDIEGSPFYSLLRTNGISDDMTGVLSAAPTLPPGWNAIGDIVASRETDEAATITGTDVLKLTLAIGEGIRTDFCDINALYASAWIGAVIESGEISLDMVDADGKSYPVERPVAAPGGDTADALSASTPAPDRLALRIIATQANTVVLLDAATLTGSADAVPWTEIMGPKELWIAAGEQAADASARGIWDEVAGRLIDASFVGADDELELGAAVEVRAWDYGGVSRVSIDTRVVEITTDLAADTIRPTVRLARRRPTVAEAVADSIGGAGDGSGNRSHTRPAVASAKQVSTAAQGASTVAVTRTDDDTSATLAIEALDQQGRQLRGYRIEKSVDGADWEEVQTDDGTGDAPDAAEMGFSFPDSGLREVRLRVFSFQTGQYSSIAAYYILNKPDSVEEIADLSDVSETPPTDGQALLWVETDDEWQPGDVSTGPPGTNPTVTIIDGDYALTTAQVTIGTGTTIDADKEIAVEIYAKGGNREDSTAYWKGPSSVLRETVTRGALHIPIGANRRLEIRCDNTSNYYLQAAVQSGQASMNGMYYIRVQEPGPVGSPGRAGTPGEQNVQADWDEADVDSDAHILNKPAIPVDTGEDNVQADWDEADADSDAHILNKPAIPVDTGDYNVQADWDEADVDSDAHILNKPAIPVDTGEDNVQADWDEADVDSDAHILNKPAIPVDTGEDNVQADWDEADADSDAHILNKPAIPVDTGEDNVQADWDEADVDSDAHILNKPAIPVDTGEDNVQADWDEADVDSDAHILNKPAIPVDTGEDNVQADWDEADADSDAHILNKPDIVTNIDDLGDIFGNPIHGDLLQFDVATLKWTVQSPQTILREGAGIVISIPNEGNHLIFSVVESYRLPQDATEGQIAIWDDTNSVWLRADQRFTAALLAKLNAIEAGATGDQTASEIAALYEGIAGVNRFTNALLTKLNAVEAGATGDLTAAEIKALIGDASETNKGILQVATTPNTTGGSNDVKAVTPLKLKERLATFVRNATSTIRGFVELATNSEVQAGTDTSRAVTPAGLASRIATTSRRGLIELATQAEVDSGNDTDRAVTPARLQAKLQSGAPTSLATSDITASEITVGWTPPSSGFVGGYTVEWRTGGAAYETATVLADTTEFTITGLDRGEDYDIRVRTTGVVASSYATTTASTLNVISQTFVIGTPTRAFSTQLGWEGESLGQINADLIAGSGDAFLRYFFLHSGSNSLRLWTFSTDSGTGSGAGPELVSGWETYAEAIVVEAGGLSLTLEGPNHSNNSGQDASEPYSWNPSTSKRAEIGTFITAWNALTDAQKAATTLTLQFEP